MPEELLEEIAILLQSGASQETIQALVAGYWEQVQQLHIIVASFFALFFSITGGVLAWLIHKRNK